MSKTFEQIRDLCQFGNAPVEGKVVVRQVGTSYSSRQYEVVSNPIGLDYDSIALFCDSGGLPFGYHLSGGLICVHTD